MTYPEFCRHDIARAAEVFTANDGEVNAKDFAKAMFIDYFTATRLLKYLIELGLVVDIHTPQGSEGQAELFIHQQELYEAHS